MLNQLAKPQIQRLSSFSKEYNIIIDVLRLDRIHPIVSGNKWYKLKYYLNDAIKQNKKTVLTFGGAYSNHIIATAFACKEFGLKSIGIIRGEESLVISATLKQAKLFGMDLHFVSRKEYNNKNNFAQKYKDTYVINEGGAGELGILGAADILKEIKYKNYTHIICACGTGTMISGLIKSSNLNQKIIGIAVLKGFEGLEKNIIEQVNTEVDASRVKIFHDYHFGGYAKHPINLIKWMNFFWQREHIPTDIVYTSKLFYGVNDLLQKNYFPKNSNLLIIHSGGLQGNSSLPLGQLLF